MAKEISVKPNGIALVDDCDYERVSRYKWHALRGGAKSRTFYPAASDKENGKRKWRKLHRLILGEDVKGVIDHIDGNTFNNQRSNLRVCENRDNIRNQGVQNRKDKTSKFKGASKSGPSWRSIITVNGKKIHIGTFPTEIEAAAAYDNAALQYFGQFARTNKALGLL